jgi:glycosyltransferase involved in cell wall biosynthesis
MPDVSVVMAVRDAAPYVRAAVDSVLAQSVRDLELVVVDDASTDGSREIVAGYADPRLVLVRNERHLGLTRSLNRGLACARAALVARHDADDVSGPERLARQMAVLAAHARVALVGSRGRLVDAAGRHVGALDRPLDPYGIRWYQMFDCAFIHGSVMFRRAVVADALGGYDESLVWAQDWELWGRVLERHDAVNLPDRLIDYRTHTGSVTMSARDPAAFRAHARRIVAANVRRTLDLALTPPDIELMCGFLLGLPRGDVPRYLALVAQLAQRFQAAYPAAARVSEPHGTIAGQIDALAARALPPGRATTMAVYAAALRRHPALVRRLPVARMLARLVLGPAGISRMRSLGVGRPAPAAPRPEAP